MVENSSVVTTFLECVTGASVHAGLFAPDAVLDATVPNWRFQAKGANAIVRELSEWYADVGQFTSLQRLATENGEVVEFTLTWMENDVAHLCHQSHALTVHDGKIANDVAFCGGRWPEALQEQMAAAQRASDGAPG